jgi:hypothetical protein
MALGHIQDSNFGGGSGSPLTAILTFGSAVAAGSTLVVGIAQTTSGARTYTVSDNIHGTSGWTLAEASGAGLDTQIWFRGNHGGGTVTVTVTHGLGTVGFVAAASEWSGFGSTVTVEASDSLEEGASASSHTCSALGVSSVNECVAFCACALNATATDCNAGSGYTEVPPSTVHNRILFQRRHFQQGCTSEVGAWTTTGTARAGRSSIALLSGPAGGGGGGGSNRSGLLLLSVG